MNDDHTVTQIDPWTIRGTQVYGPPIRWTGKVTAIRRCHPNPGCPLCAIDPHCPQHRNPIVDQITVANLITTLGINWIRTALSDSGFDPALRYMAWGSGITAAAAGDTVLDTEAGRKAITSFAAGATGVMVSTTYLSPAEGNGSLAELGWFATDTATATVDTGVLIARVLYPGGTWVKDAGYSLQLDRTDTFA